MKARPFQGGARDDAMFIGPTAEVDRRMRVTTPLSDDRVQRAGWGCRDYQIDRHIPDR